MQRRIGSRDKQREKRQQDHLRLSISYTPTPNLSKFPFPHLPNPPPPNNQHDVGRVGRRQFLPHRTTAATRPGFPLEFRFLLRSFQAQGSSSFFLIYLFTAKLGFLFFVFVFFEIFSFQLGSF